MTQTWSGFKVDGYNFGAGDGSGAGLGFADVTSGKSGTVDSTGLTVDDNTLTTAGGGLTFHNRTVASQSINEPSGGWANLPAC
jgi:hypothetical protein